jgi:hypothetical protein
MRTLPRSSRISGIALNQCEAATKGSLLIVAMILCAVIGISITSYLGLGRTGMEISNRALYNNGAMNLAENGLEQAVFAINKSVEDTSFSWSSSPNSWTIEGSNAKKKWTGYEFGQGATGIVRSYVYDYTGGAAPTIVTRATVTVGGASTRTIDKWIKVQLRKTSKFANGLVAKDSISFSGNNASVDSWNSDPGNDGVGLVPYSAGVKNDNGSVGSISVSVGAVLVNNADIWGYASTGGALPSVGANGTVGPFGTASGTMDMNNVSTDFTASFDPVTTPTTGTTIAAITTLPMTLGTAGATTEVRVPSISSSGNDTNVLTILGNVIMVITATAGNDAINLSGNASIAIAAGASLTIYTEGNVAIGGNGVANGGTTAATANRPINFQIWGTSTSTSTDQTIAIKGNGALSATVYAPNATVTINGNGDVMGSVVAEDISLTGNANFHYDESLAFMDSGNPYRVSLWKELTTTADRSAYSSVLSW